MKKGTNNKSRPDRQETYKPEKAKKIKKPQHLNGRGKHKIGFAYN